MADTTEQEYDGSVPLRGMREQFARIVAANETNHTEAARQAGFKNFRGLRRYAHRLTTDSKVKARIAYFQAKMAEKFDVNRETATKTLLEHAQRCLEAGDNRTYLATMSELYSICGLKVQKVEQVTSEEQQRLDAIRAAEARRVAAIALRERVQRQPVGALDRWSNGNNSDISSESEESGSLSGQ
jgi:hypothetical protein